MKTIITIVIPDYELADSDTEELIETLRSEVENWLWLKEEITDPAVGVSVRVKEDD